MPMARTLLLQVEGVLTVTNRSDLHRVAQPPNNRPIKMSELPKPDSPAHWHSASTLIAKTPLQP